MSTATTAIRTTASLPQGFAPGWNRVRGVEVDGTAISVDPEKYFFRYDDPSWVVCSWHEVERDLLTQNETKESTVEQQTLDYVRANGRVTDDPAEVLSTAAKVYSFIFRDDLLDEPDLDFVTADHMRILREMGTLMALNRVQITGDIANVGPAWFFGYTAQLVFDLSQEESETLDDLYHGTFFNEYRRIESVRAHAALGGRLVHGCHGSPNMSGGCVVPFGANIEVFREQLGQFKESWIREIFK